MMRSSDLDQSHAKKGSGSKENPSKSSDSGSGPKQLHEKNQKQQKDDGSNGNVKQIGNRVGDGGRGESVQIGRA